MAAGSMVITETTHTSVKKIFCAWTASTGDAGDVTAATTNAYDGAIIGAVTIPGGAGDAPDPNYDVYIYDSDSVDIALGSLKDRHTSNTEVVKEANMAGAAGCPLTITVENAGSGNKGTIILYIR